MSVFSQTMPVDEIVIADDSSTDGSRELIDSLVREYKNIKPVLRERNVGVAANRDLAVREASGQLITTLDGDDWFLPDKIEAEYRRLQFASQSNLIAYSNICLAQKTGEIIDCLDTSAFANLNERQKMRWLASRLGPIPRDMLLPKNLYIEVDGLRHLLPRYEDWDFKMRLAAHQAKWVHSGTSGVVYRQTESGLSSVGSVAQLNSQYRVLFDNSKLLIPIIGYHGFTEAIGRVVLRAATLTAKRMVHAGRAWMWNGEK